jgi:hypothetical protein
VYVLVLDQTEKEKIGKAAKLLLGPDGVKKLLKEFGFKV